MKFLNVVALLCGVFCFFEIKSSDSQMVRNDNDCVTDDKCFCCNPSFQPCCCFIPCQVYVLNVKQEGCLKGTKDFCSRCSSCCGDKKAPEVRQMGHENNEAK